MQEEKRMGVGGLIMAVVMLPLIAVGYVTGWIGGIVFVGASRGFMDSVTWLVDRGEREVEERD